MASGARNYWRLVPMALVVLAAFGALAMSFGVAIGAFYHPHADGSAFAKVRLNIAVAFFVLSIVILVLQAVFLPRMTVRSAGVCALGFGALYGAVLGIGSALTMQPDSYVQYVGEQPYQIPRHYSPRGHVDPGTEAGLGVKVCISSGAAIYAEPCHREIGFPQSELVTLKPGPLTDDFQISRALMERGIAFEGDLIAPLGVAQTWSYDGPEGDVTGDRLSVFDVRMLMNTQRKLVLTADCHTNYCRVQMTTPEGTLSFPSQGSTFDPQKWRADAEHFRQLVQGWRCLPPHCADEVRE
ncbi:hypothetical protein [Tateyamaria sp.]|uniref:hypothetical protein n=1 Tax=Tateyamaria sp. TaxID=1929288 RepID=UPI00329DC0E6